MPPDRWKEIDDLFQRALDLPPARRVPFVEELTERDEELGRAVEELLRAAENSEPFLASSVDATCEPPWDEVFATADGGRADEAADRSGERIGPYRLVRRLGRGGMATVYLAERADGLWEQRVALKLIRRGLDTEDVVRRFLAERQILSSLRHPNIASLLDGGTTADGLPFLVMEYVEGTPITEYCDERRLPVDERLRLFCEVGRAVQHAHGSLVVHRDLKPSNILVTGAGRVKLLDFGIAKLLDPEADSEDADLTRPGHRPHTPRCASPEQIAGGPITTKSDVYQLGILLYRLLAGRRPDAPDRTWLPAAFRDVTVPEPPSRAVLASDGEAADGESDAAWIASARGTTPERLARRLRGDLDTIVGEALRAEPEERYASVAALVEDVERHAEQLPIRARPATRRYRTRKFLARNRWVGPVVAAALVAAAGYAFTMSRNARALERERNVARAEAERAEEIRGFMTGLFRSADPYAPADPERGRSITVVQALEIGADRVRSELADRPALQADLFGAIADVYANLDLREPAIRLREEAHERAVQAHGPRSVEAAVHLRELGSLQSAAGDLDSAGSLLTAALELTRARRGAEDTAYAAVLAELGHLAERRGRHEEAARRLEEAISLLERAPSLPAPERLAPLLGSLTSIYFHLDRTEDANRAARRAVNLFRNSVGDEHPRTALARVQLADTHDGVEEPERAVEEYERAIPVLDRTLGPEHSETVGARNNLAFSLLRTGEPARAEEVLREVLRQRIAKNGEEHADVADALQNLAAALNQQRKLDEAEATLDRAHEVYEAVLEPGHFLIAYPLLTLSEIRLERGDHAGAESAASEATRILRDALPEGHYATAVAECRWGRALAGIGRTAEASLYLEGAAATLLGDPRAVRHEEACLKAAVEHLRSLGADRERWARFAERLDDIRGEPAGSAAAQETG